MFDNNRKPGIPPPNLAALDRRELARLVFDYAMFVYFEIEALTEPPQFSEMLREALLVEGYAVATGAQSRGMTAALRLLARVRRQLEKCVHAVRDGNRRSAQTLSGASVTPDWLRPRRDVLIQTITAGRAVTGADAGNGTLEDDALV